ncbi:MAG: hypothetical protein ACI8XO_004822 [Verrucomicrobiales bacterium]|jgi:hypothetical protein
MKIVSVFFLATAISMEAGVSADLTPKNLPALHEMFQAKPDELIWKDSIPWRTDLWEARREAAVAGKPIFLWEMDGHPLGCT